MLETVEDQDNGTQPSQALEYTQRKGKGNGKGRDREMSEEKGVKSGERTIHKFLAKLKTLTVDDFCQIKTNFLYLGPLVILASILLKSKGQSESAADDPRIVPHIQFK